jgi:large subunit ribosomal protein L18
MSKSQKAIRREKIKMRIRKRITGTEARPRLVVYRSNAQIYCQVIDDVAGRTLCAASSREEGINQSGAKVDQAKNVGLLIARKAKAAGVESVVFDRGGNLYHGRVKSLADGAREGGLLF